MNLENGAREGICFTIGYFQHNDFVPSKLWNHVEEGKIMCKCCLL